MILDSAEESPVSTEGKISQMEGEQKASGKI